MKLNYYPETDSLYIDLSDQRTDSNSSKSVIGLPLLFRHPRPRAGIHPPRLLWMPGQARHDRYFNTHSRASHRQVSEGLDGEVFIEVVGRNGQLNRDQCDFKYFQDSVDTEYANSETDFSLSLEPWEHWLGMRIDSGTLDKFAAPQIVAYCLWDMTFHGFEQWQVQETMDEIKRRADEIDAMTEEERKEKLIPMEDVIRKLESSEKEK